MRMQELEANYQRFEETKAAYNKAKKEHDKAAAEEAWDAYQGLEEETEAKAKDYELMMRLYRTMKERGNDYLSVDGHDYDDEERLLEIFREYGVEAFTFTCTSTNALDRAWNFQKAGAQNKGIVEIKGRRSDKEHGFLFTLN